MKSPTPVKQRRTHEERSSAMRKRLLTATLESLSVDGYAGSTLSSIVRRAGVSRGAQVHHYPNKQALMIDAAEDLLKRTYRRLGELLLSISSEDDRLGALVHATWEQIFSTPLYRAYCELVAASQRDPALSEALRGLLPRVMRLFEPAANHYFESSDPRQRPAEIFLQLSSLLSGLALQAPLLNNDALIRLQLEGWVRQVAPVMRARKGITAPPPRPAQWDSPLEAKIPPARP
ncbi:MAG TPA: TetR/AcrR family transcriptional regulator [Solimonas sp.]|nr:TetR/AcrR family transcriptional regulator [Solimonas sp.]